MRPIRSKVLPLVAVAFAGCWTDRQYHYYYPSALDAPTAQLFAWPTGEDDAFRFLAQDDAIGFGNSNEVGAILNLRTDQPKIDQLVAGANSITVMLGPTSAPEQRAHALEFVERAGRDHSGLSVHVVNIEQDLQNVSSGMQLHGVLVHEASFRERARPAGGLISMFAALGALLELQQRPNLVFVPLSSAPDRFAICGDFRALDQQPAASECEEGALAEELRARLPRLEASELVSAWGSLNGGERFEFGLPVQGVFVALCLPHDMPADRRERCEELARSLCSADAAPITVAVADASWNWSECTSAESVLARIGVAPDWSFAVGPVRQISIIPKPEKRDR